MDLLGSKKLMGKSSLAAKNKGSSVSASASTNVPRAKGNLIFLNFCQPARIYLILAFLSLLYFVSIENSIIWLIIKAIIFIGWAFMLDKLCTTGNKAIAWLFAIVPQCILMLLSMKSSSAKSVAPSPLGFQTT